VSLLERVQSTVSAVKIFPLPSVVLFPGAAVPLHIFEPRYRQMVRESLAGDRVLALAQLVPGWEGDYQGRPPMRPLCCVGVIGWHEVLDEGRFNVIVQGVVRARILEERSPEAPYRVARVSPLPDAPFEGAEVEALRRALFDLATRAPGEGSRSLLQLAMHAQGGGLADLVASATVGEVQRRQELLEMLEVPARLRSVLSDVSELAARLGTPGPDGAPN